MLLFQTACDRILKRKSCIGQFIIDPGLFRQYTSYELSAFSVSHS